MRRLGMSTGPLLLATVLLVIGFFVAAGAVFALVVGGGSGWLVALALAAGTFMAFAGRLMMVGVYVGDRGVWVRTPLRTWAVGWSTILSVRSRKTSRTYTVQNVMSTVAVRQMCFDLVDGQTFDLPLQGAFRGEDRPWLIPDVQPADEFDRLLAEMRHLTATHGHRQTSDPVAEP